MKGDVITAACVEVVATAVSVLATTTRALQHDAGMHRSLCIAILYTCTTGAVQKGRLLPMRLLNVWPALHVTSHLGAQCDVILCKPWRWAKKHQQRGGQQSSSLTPCKQTQQARPFKKIHSPHQNVQLHGVRSRMNSRLTPAAQRDARARTVQRPTPLLRYLQFNHELVNNAGHHHTDKF